MIMDAVQIQGMIPHRWPFLLVDRVIELEPGVRGVGIKNVTVNEWFFQGHVPGYPIMPGVLIVEALAQVGLIALRSVPEYKEKMFLFAGIEDFRFRRPVVPGDSLRLEVELVSQEASSFTFSAKAMSGDKTAAQGKVTLAFPR